MMKTILIAALAAALPVAARADGGRACEALVAKAAALGETTSCRAGHEGLTLVLSETSFAKLKIAAFPQGTFEGHAVVRLPEPVTPQEAASLRDAVSSPRTARAERLITHASFDGAAARGGFTPVAGPPGSNGGDKEKETVPAPKSGTRPGSTPSQPQPQPRPGSTPPGSGSKPTPPAAQPVPKPSKVYIPPAPPPHWGNTVSWGTIPAWASLPNEWDQNRVIQHDDRNATYVTRWFTYGAEMPRYAGIRGDEGAQRRRAGQDSLSFRLVAHEQIEITQRYYRGVFDLRWNTFDAEWQGRFREYEAAARVWVMDGPARAENLRVTFDMQGQTLMPWETEVVRGFLDARGLSARVDHPAYVYTRAPTVAPGEVVYVAQDKLLTPPDDDGVTVELVPDHANKTIALRVHDKWAGYYRGETLEVQAKVMFVTDGWFTANKAINTYAFANGSQLRLPSAVPAGAPGAGASYDRSLNSQGCGKYYVESWSFRRANNARPDNASRISLPTIVGKGGTRRIEVCE